MELSTNKLVEILLVLTIVVIAAIILIAMIAKSKDSVIDIKLNSSKLGFGTSFPSHDGIKVIESFIYNCIHKAISRGAGL
jgi:hypothetical protein